MLHHEDKKDTKRIKKFSREGAKARREKGVSFG